MFILVTRQDIIPVPPHLFGEDLDVVVRYLIDQKYANQVLLNIGLCICLYNVISIEEALIHPGEGDAFTKVKFRLVVFGPFIGQVLEGRVVRQDRNGMQISIGNFFPHVRIPASLMEDNTTFDNETEEWVWHLNTGGDEAELTPFPIYNESLVRFRVHKTEYVSVKESNSRSRVTIATAQQEERDEGNLALPRSRNRSRSVSFDLPAASSGTRIGENVGDLARTFQARNAGVINIQGRINETGLGMTEWWEPASEDGAETAT